MSQSPSHPSQTEARDRYAKAWSATNILTRRGHSFSGHERHVCFLNTGNARFADVSAAVGVDLPEDGRSLAIVDWDHDGDLDVWMSNRTGPRVRFIRNEFPRTNHFLALKLEGRSSNRDAIGARVELLLRNSGAQQDFRKRIKTLHAGDGFLGQSSKIVHFGLGHEDGIEQVIVQWPGGDREVFRELRGDGHYYLVEGSGRASAWQPPGQAVELAAKAADVAPPTTEQARVVLVGRVPMPDAPYQTLDGEAVSLIDNLDGPLLVNLAASWCQPCITELHAWSQREPLLRERGMRVIVLSVDQLGESPSEANWRETLERLKLPFESGFATAELVTALDITQQTLLDRKRPLPVPCSFLVDRQGQLAVIYKGQVDIEVLLGDWELLEADPEVLRDAAVPLSGKWLLPPASTDPLVIAAALRDNELIDTAIRYTEQLLVYFTEGAGAKYVRQENRVHNLAAVRTLQGRMLLDRGRLAEANVALRHAVELSPDDRRAARMLQETIARIAVQEDPNDVAPRTSLALLLLQQGKVQEAGEQVLEALVLDEDYGPAHQVQGMLHSRREQWIDAAASFDRALELAPGLEFARNAAADAYFRAGLKAFSRQEAAEATIRFRQAIERNDEFAEAHFLLGQVLQRTGDSAAAATQFQRVIELRPDNAEAHNNLGIAYAKQNELELAISCFQEAVKSNPAFVQAHVNLANGLLQTGRLAEARQQFLKALELAPDAQAATDGLRNVEAAIQQKGTADPGL